MRPSSAALLLLLVACHGDPAPATAPGVASVERAPAASPTASAFASASASASASVSASASASASVPAIPGRPRGALATPADAIRAFQAAWREEILPLPRARTSPAGSTPDVMAPKRVSARRVACRDGYHRVKDTLGLAETDLILFSQTSAVDREGQCWEVVVQTGRWNEILGYLDPKTGALLFAWLVPEG